MARTVVSILARQPSRPIRLRARSIPRDGPPSRYLIVQTKPGARRRRLLGPTVARARAASCVAQHSISEWLYARLYVLAEYHVRLFVVSGAPEGNVTQVLHQATHTWHIGLMLARAKRGRWRVEPRRRFQACRAVATGRATPCVPLRVRLPGRISPAGELPAPRLESHNWPRRAHAPGGTPPQFLDQGIGPCVVTRDTPI